MEKSIKTKIETNRTETSKIDELGRVHIKLETREKLKINEGDKFEVYIKENAIILRKLNVIVEKENILEMKSIIDKDIEVYLQMNKISNTILDCNDIGHHVRRIDELGRVVIPIELRRKLNIVEGNIIKINYQGNCISLIKKERDDNNGNKNSYNNKRHKENCRNH